MKKILVTGGAGFIGSHLCKKLKGDGCFVYCVDNLYTGRRDNLYHSLNSSDFEFIEHDITIPIDIEVDQIYNLACPASPVHYQADPVRTMKTSILGIINMLDLSRKYGARLLHTSTSEVYGDPEVHPQPESYWGHVNPIGIRACYDEGKRAAETLVFDYCRQYNIDIKVVRIFNTYGSHMAKNDGRVVSNFIVQALKGDDITIYGNGTQTRSFCYIDDMVEGIVRMMNSRNGFTGPVNLGNPAEFTIMELAELVVRMTGSKSKIVQMPLPADDPTQRKPLIDLAIKELGWIPEINLDEGLGKTIAYFKALIKEERA